MSRDRPEEVNVRQARNLRLRLAVLGFLAIAAFFVLTEHRAHVFGIVPYLLLLACPLLHFFLHRDHGRHGGEPKP